MKAEIATDLEPWAIADCCEVCGSPYTHRHHIFYGTGNRPKSEYWGYVVMLCADHHTGAHGVHHGNKELDLMLKRKAQRHFEQTHTREQFIKEFGRSWL